LSNSTKIKETGTEQVDSSGTEDNEKKKEPGGVHDHFVHLHKVGSCTDANFPKDEEGRVYHIGVKRGEVCNRILTVGDPRRAKSIAQLLDTDKEVFSRSSNRGFTVFTGFYKTVPVTIIAIGMGVAMMDFFVRECRNVVEGDMVIIRLGTCGTPVPSVKVGSISVPTDGCTMIIRNPDAWTEDNKSENGIDYYRFCKPVNPNKLLTEQLVSNLQKFVPDRLIVEGLNATADTFYSSQGRIDSSFNDHNETLIDTLVKKFPNVVSLEMETFHLLDLSQISNKSNGLIYSSGCHIVLAQRRSNDFLDNDTLHKVEKQAGEAILNTLISFQIDPKNLMNDAECVWNN